MPSIACDGALGGVAQVEVVVLDVVAAVAERREQPVAETRAPGEGEAARAGAARIASNATASTNERLMARDPTRSRVVLHAPIHQEGWAHFTSSPDALRAAFAAAGLSDRLRQVEPCEVVGLTE